MKRYQHAVHIPPARRVRLRSGTVPIPLRRPAPPRDTLRARDWELTVLAVLMLVCAAMLWRYFNIER